jgi:hypothetical protein
MTYYYSCFTCVIDHSNRSQHGIYVLLNPPHLRFAIHCMLFEHCHNLLIFFTLHCVCYHLNVMKNLHIIDN